MQQRFTVIFTPALTLKELVGQKTTLYRNLLFCIHAGMCDLQYMPYFSLYASSVRPYMPKRNWP